MELKFTNHRNVAVRAGGTVVRFCTYEPRGALHEALRAIGMIHKVWVDGDWPLIGDGKLEDLYKNDPEFREQLIAELVKQRMT
jgi:hypothetical protein